MKLKLTPIQVLELYDCVAPRMTQVSESARAIHPLNHVYIKLRQHLVSAMNASDVVTKEPHSDLLNSLQMYERWNQQQQQKISRIESSPVTAYESRPLSETVSDILQDDDPIDGLMDLHYPKMQPKISSSPVIPRPGRKAKWKHGHKP